MKQLHVPDWEADIKQWLKHPDKDSYALIPPENLWGYNARDVAYGFQLHNLFRPQVAAEKDLERLYTKLLIPGANALVQLSVQGVRIDLQRLQDLRADTEALMEQLTLEMRTIVGDEEFNPASPKQVGHYLYEVAKAPPFSRSKPLPTEQLEALNVPRGRSDTTTAMDQMERLAQGGYPCSPFASLMVQHRHAKTLVRTYLKNFIPESDGRVHPSYRLAGTVTGRLAGNDPNILNLPRSGKVRSLVVAEEGNILISVDYKACELRVLGALAHSDSLMKMFKNGLDPHDETGKIVYGKHYDPAKHRVGVKQVNFGVAYGRGVSSIATALSISFEEAKQIRDTVLDFLGVAPWIEEQYRLAKEQGYVATPTGRRRRFPLITDANWNSIQRQAINAPVQGTASDLCLMSLIAIDKWIREYRGMILFPMHDSLLIEVPERHLPEVAPKIVEEMLKTGVRIFGPRFQAGVDISIGHNYGKEQMRDFSLDEIGGVI
jgi:DNA polymerase-1